MSTRFVFRASCTINPKHTHQDDVLAEVLPAVDEHHVIERNSVHSYRATPQVVSVIVDFWAANENEAQRTARAAFSALAHRWPTDTVSLDGLRLQKGA